MNKDLRIPPQSRNDLTSPQILANKLSTLIGQKFVLTGKTRTDGSNARKLVVNILEADLLPTPALDGNYTIVPPRRKGVPRILREYIDTYLVTTGNSYNLQVWNRNPASDSVQVEYSSGEALSASDVRFVFLRVDVKNNLIRSVIVLTPDYIQKRFGKFGKPTIKQQLIISGKARQSILSDDPPILFYADTPRIPVCHNG